MPFPACWLAIIVWSSPWTVRLSLLTNGAIGVNFNEFWSKQVWLSISFGPFNLHNLSVKAP